MNKYVTELIGTFFLVLTIGATVIGLGAADAGFMAPLAIGAVLTVMVYAGGHISGAHYNPAITLAVWMRGRCPTSEVPGYIIAQILGAVLAALVVGFLTGGPAAPPAPIDIPKSLVAELLCTFALAYVVLNVATAKANSGNSYFGLAIGLTVTASAYAVGNISGGVFNPAVAIGVGVMNLVNITDIWVHIVADFAGAALAALVFRFVNPTDT